MPLDTSIAMGYRPMQMPNQLAQYAQMQQIMGGQQEQQLNALKMQEAQAAIQERNALSRAYSSSINPETGQIDYNKLTGLVAGAGAGAQLPGIEKTRRELETANLTQQKARSELLDAKLKQSRGFLDTIDPTSPDAAQKYLAWHEANHRDPIVGAALKERGITADQSRQDIQAAIERGPEALAQLITRSKLGTEKFMDLNKPTTVAAGGSVYDPVTKKFTQAPEKTPAPPAPPSMVAEYTFAKTPDGGNFKGSYQDFVTARAIAGRAPAQPVAPTITQIVDPTDPNKMIAIDARRYQGGGAGSPGVIGVSGKEPGAELRQNKVEAGKTQLADDLDNLRESFKTLNKMEAIPSTERGPISNISSATAASGLGQMLGRATGTEAQVERDVINSARQRLVNSIKNATGMSAQQLNSNVELQTMLKSISDPGQSFQAAMRIIDDIENAYVKGTGELPKRSQSGKVTSTTIAPADKQALDWANANPKDPRALQIKQRLGQ